MQYNSRLVGRAGGELALGRAPAQQQEQTVDDLATLLRERAPGAWEMLFEQHFDQIYRYARAQLSDRHAAEDAAAATFERAVSAIERYSDRGRPLIAWLYGIARNVMLEEYRRQKSAKARSKVVSLFGLKPKEEMEASLGQVGDDVEGWLDLRKELSEITDAQREVILLRYIVGLSAGDTARVMGREVGAVYALQARALATLRRRMTT